MKAALSNRSPSLTASTSQPALEMTKKVARFAKALEVPGEHNYYVRPQTAGYRLLASPNVEH